VNKVMDLRGSLSARVLLTGLAEHRHCYMGFVSPIFGFVTTNLTANLS